MHPLIGCGILQQADGGWVINGTKEFITNSGTDITSLITVCAVTGRKPDGRPEFSSFLVPIGTPGLTVEPAYSKVGWHASDTHPLTFVNVAMVYTHYFGVMVVALQVFCVLLRSRPWRKVLASASVTALAFSPWLLAASRAAAAKGGLAGNLNWVPRPGLSEFFWFFIDLAGCAETYWAGAYLAPVIFALLAVALWKLEQRREMLLFGCVFAALPALLTFFASRSLSLSVWGHRHMLFAAAPFLLLSVASVCRLNAKWAMPILTIWAVQLCLPMVHDDKKLAWDRLAVAAMREERSQANVPFFTVDPYSDYTFRYYLDQRFVVTKATPQDLHGKHFWVAYNEGSESLEATLRGRGCRVGATFRESDRYHAVRVFPVQCE